MRGYRQRMPRALIEQLFENVWWIETDDGREFQVDREGLAKFMAAERPTPWRERQNPRRAPDPGDAEIGFGA